MIGIINVTQHCNLSCKYCFEENWKEKNISIDTINEEFKKALPLFVQFANSLCNGKKDEVVQILLHGGEPFLIKPDFLNSFFEMVSSNNTNVTFLVQSNGTIINEKLIEILKKYHVKVGFSLDGNKQMNDLFRVTNKGKGTHDLVLKNYKLLKENNIDVGCLVTFTGANLPYVRELYQFFSDNEIDFSFNPFFVPSLYEDYHHIGFNIEDYSKAMCELFDIWINDTKSNINIMSFVRIIDALTNEEHRHHTCTFTNDCGNNFVAIDINGHLYTCNHYCSNPELSYSKYQGGNIYDEISKNPIHNRWDYLKQQDCKNCEIQELCFGGCPYHALIHEGDELKKDYLCSAYKKIIKHIYNYLLLEIYND